MPTDENGVELEAWPPYSLLSRHQIYDCPWGGLRRDMVKLDNGAAQELHVVEITDSIAVVPEMADGRIAMLWQFRHAHGKTHWEIPAGRIDPGEEPAEAALRELHEEAGCKTTNLAPMGGFYPTNGISKHYTHFFTTHNCVLKDKPQPDAAERIQIVLRDREVVRRELEAGAYEDGFTALALFYYFARTAGR